MHPDEKHYRTIIGQTKRRLFALRFILAARRLAVLFMVPLSRERTLDLEDEQAERRYALAEFKDCLRRVRNHGSIDAAARASLVWIQRNDEGEEWKNA